VDGARVNAEQGLSAEARARIADLGTADIVVGIPSFQNARTIGHVARAAQTGLAKYFPDLRGVVMNSDGGSTDGTPDVVAASSVPDADLLLLRHPLSAVRRFSAPYHGLPGKGSAFRAIFRAADLLHARACVVVDADLRSIAPEWIHLLAAPVIERGCDLVAPYYLRHKYDGTITNSVVYPLTRALYGQRVRQPIGGDFGLSPGLVRHCLAQDVWDTDVARYGIDIWMTTSAICGGFVVGQSFLGAKIHDPKDPAADLTAMLTQVVGTVFRLMETHEAVWQATTGSRDVALMGFRFGVGLEPVAVNRSAMIEHFRRGVRDLHELWAQVFSAGDLASLRAMAAGDAEAFGFDDGLWVRIVFDLAAAFHHRAMDPEHLLRACLPLYMGRVAAMVGELADLDTDAVEARLERLCVTFEREKPYLRARWAGHQRPA
jgi:glucosylglycerate synthase